MNIEKAPLTLGQLQNIISVKLPYFFQRGTLKFFGERMCEMRLFKKTKMISDNRGIPHKCYVISVTRRILVFKPVHPYKYYFYFDVNDFDRVHPFDENLNYNRTERIIR